MAHSPPPEPDRPTTTPMERLIEERLVAKGGSLPVPALAADVGAEYEGFVGDDWFEEFVLTHLAGAVEAGLVAVHAGPEPIVELRPEDERHRFAGP